MGRRSTNEKKNIYWISREEAGLTRDAAAEKMEYVSTDRIERIEYEKSDPHPDEVLRMAECYNKPSLCNYYCSHDCPIGQVYVPAVEEKSLSQITVEMLNTLNILNDEKNRFLQIVVDGQLSESEVEDFDRIQKELEQMAMIIDSLRLWSDNLAAKGDKGN